MADFFSRQHPRWILHPGRRTSPNVQSRLQSRLRLLPLLKEKWEHQDGKGSNNNDDELLCCTEIAGCKLFFFTQSSCLNMF